ncbi:LOW QUALITY PROTEIN: uncharacterized protein, partial [Heliangelus exortis]|uniref:LOW QUALITY PROTEIN: uncharacterized protein n=1 Tax=Heliangelus exortis TaxID=472823 RepID=UPI003A8D5723
SALVRFPRCRRCRPQYRARSCSVRRRRGGKGAWRRRFKYDNETKFPETAATTHRLHVRLPLPPSAAFSNNSHQSAAPGPGDVVSCHGDRGRRQLRAGKGRDGDAPAGAGAGGAGAEPGGNAGPSRGGGGGGRCCEAVSAACLLMAVGRLFCGARSGLRGFWCRLLRRSPWSSHSLSPLRSSLWRSGGGGGDFHRPGSVGTGCRAAGTVWRELLVLSDRKSMRGGC